jgi:hypothetical protein
VVEQAAPLIFKYYVERLSQVSFARAVANAMQWILEARGEMS